MPEAWRAAMTEMSRLAYNAYEALVHKDPEFDQIPALRAIRLPYKPRSG